MVLETNLAVPLTVPRAPTAVASKLLVDHFGGYRRFQRLLYRHVQASGQENQAKKVNIIDLQEKGGGGEQGGEYAQQVADHQYPNMAETVRQDAYGKRSQHLNDVTPDVQESSYLWCLHDFQ